MSPYRWLDPARKVSKSKSKVEEFWEMTPAQRRAWSETVHLIGLTVDGRDVCIIHHAGCWFARRLAHLERTAPLTPLNLNTTGGLD